MRYALAALAFLVTPVLAAEGVTGLAQGMDYSEARATVLRQGWQADTSTPMQKDELQQALQAFFIGKGYGEFVNCQPTGLGICTARFHNGAGRQLFLFTGEPDDNSARLTSWCLGRPDPNCRGAIRR